MHVKLVRMGLVDGTPIDSRPICEKCFFCLIVHLGLGHPYEFTVAAADPELEHISLPAPLFDFQLVDSVSIVRGFFALIGLIAAEVYGDVEMTASVGVRRLVRLAILSETRLLST